MGYYSELEFSAKTYRRDDSLPAEPQDILIARLRELNNCLETFRAHPPKNQDRFCFTEAELQTILPEDLPTISDLKAAIRLAEKRLAERYGILEEEPVQEEIAPLQLSFADFCPCAA